MLELYGTIDWELMHLVILLPKLSQGKICGHQDLNLPFSTDLCILLEAKGFQMGKMVVRQSQKMTN